mgnify:CR=1 FL=1
MSTYECPNCKLYLDIDTEWEGSYGTCAHCGIYVETVWKFYDKPDEIHHYELEEEHKFLFKNDKEYREIWEGEHGNTEYVPDNEFICEQQKKFENVPVNLHKLKEMNWSSK